MRLHLVIQRHGLPVTRILWTTAPPSLFGQNAPSTPAVVPAAASAITSTRTPNALYANGGYTIAQLLEDVNGVIPLETEPALFDSECSGQWGLEDYVVEVAGSECLHFMEVDGLLRDGDEVLIRALQLSDLRARRLSGRHQISTDGRHLIDGVPFGKPFLKRPTSSRPAITIPPRKKRRTSIVSWGGGPAGYEDEDADWAPGRIRSLKELSALREGSGSEDKPDDDEYEGAFQDDYEDFHQAHEDTGDGTVIRYNVDKNEDDQASESDADISDFDDGDLTEELKDLKEDIDTSAKPEIEKADDEQAEHGGYSLRTRSSLHQTPRPSILQNGGRKLPDADASRRDSKAVRFEGPKEPSPAPPTSDPAQKSPVTIQPEDTVAADKASSSSSSSRSSSSSDVSSDASSNSENSSSSSNSSSSDSDSSSSDSDDSASDSELEDVSGISISNTKPPGLGSQRTKKSNQRNKMRRRLTKLKELGALPAEADFAALRDLEEKHGGSFRFPGTTSSTKENEQTEFEAKRQKLLRDLESGGIDVTEKENVPPNDKKNNNQVPASEKESTASAAENAHEASAESKRRTLDVASSRRLLFGSLGVRTPRTKEDEEATRKKLAGKVRDTVSQKQATEETPAEVESDSEENWQDKLLIRATECIFDDVELTAPPFPFEQRWDTEAGDIIRQRKGWGKKRRRKQRIQVYDGQDEEEEYYGNGGHWDEDEEGLQLNYDDTEQPYHDMEGVEQTGQEDAPEETDKDLPEVSDDPSSLGDLVEGDLKKGTVIAFKQLDMSKATNWQPTVSGYRVAEIHDVFEDEILKLRLAKRDRRQPKMTEDDEDEPQYSGFEMPGFDDDEAEDDGFREVSFSDLIDSKLLRAATVAGGPGDAEKASFSPQEPPERSPTPDAKADEKAPPKDQQLTQEDPDTLTKDVVDAVRASGEDSSFGVRSPEFHGFQSSDEDLGSASPGSPSHSHRADHEDNGGQEYPGDNEEPNSGVRLSEPSTPPSSVPQNRSNEAPPQPTGSDPDLEMISSPETPESFNRLIASLFDNKVGIKKSPSPASKAEKTTEQRPETEPNGEKKQGQDQEPARPTSQSSACSVVPNPFYEIDRAHEKQQRHKSTKTANSLGAEDGDTTMNYQSAIEYPSSPAQRQSPIAERPPSPSQQDASLISAVPETLLEDPTAQEADLMPPDSQMESSQVIDLTQSSPPVSPDGSDEDFARSNRLPRGPGWVQKNMPKTRRLTRHSLGGRGGRLFEDSTSPPAPRRRRGRTRG